MRILVLADHAVGISGPHRNVVGTLNALSARGDVDLRVLTGKFDPSEPYATRCEIRLDFEPHRPGRAWNNMRRLRDAIADRDLVYVPTGLKSFLYAFSAKGKRKLVAGPNVTGIPILMNPANPGPLMTTKMADGWIEMSEVRVRECMSAGTPRERIYLIPHAIDTEKFNPKWCDRNVWQREGLDPGTPKIVWVGDMSEERKGIPQLVEAFRLIRHAYTAPVDLVLIGKEGPMLTPGHRILPGLYLLGPRYGHDLVRLLASADLFLAASRYETFWFAPLEAMACGLPVVVSKVGAVPLMIPEDGVQGRAVPVVDSEYHYVPDAAERLAQAALPLLRSKELRIVMGHTARQHVLEHFSEARLSEDLVRTFSNVLQTA